jgi:hypothetical protein
MSLERHEARVYIQSHYYNPKPGCFQEIEDVLFSEFNEKALERISDTLDLRVGAERLLRFTLNQHYPPRINPIDYRTFSWWNENVTQLFEQSEPDSNKKSSWNGGWVFFFILVVVVQTGRACSDAQRSNDHRTRFNKEQFELFDQAIESNPQLDTQPDLRPDPQLDLQLDLQLDTELDTEPDAELDTELDLRLDPEKSERVYLFDINRD